MSVFVPTVDYSGLDALFHSARSHNGWTEDAVDETLLREVYLLARMGPTTANSQPMRIVFVASREAKERLRPALASGNVNKVMTAPVCAIFAYDIAFYETLRRTFPHTDARAWFVDQPEATNERTALRNASLQAAYFMLAARAVGLDCGPMSGFDNARVDETFFAGSTWRSNFLCSIGRGDPAKLHPRNPRLDFDETCRLE